MGIKKGIEIQYRLKCMCPELDSLSPGFQLFIAAACQMFVRNYVTTHRFLII
jgi:hypothetical protein